MHESDEQLRGARDGVVSENALLARVLPASLCFLLSLIIFIHTERIR